MSNITETLITAPPNDTVNLDQLAVTGGTTNAGLLLTPKGNGPFLVGPVPTNAGLDDGATPGAWAISIVPVYGRNQDGGRAGAGGQGAVAIGQMASATGSYDVAIGGGAGSGNYAAAATGGYSAAIGSGANATGSGAVALGSTTASGVASLATGSAGTANRRGERRHTNHYVMGAPGSVDFRAANVTTDTTPTELFLDYSDASVRFTVNSDTVITGILTITGIKSDGTVAVYIRQVSIKNIGGTTALVGSVNTLGTDTAASTSISVAADDTNDSLQILVTGTGTDTWRWCAQFSGVEVSKP